ncbi:MAG: hypothetical protein SWJ54_10620 [Cyanobacteriota bacterium]|nr:hypothetical protein [Cyanobacteriota bacterium]
MPYNQFSIEQIKLNFGIEIRDKPGMFADIPEVEYSDFLTEVLDQFVPVALEIDTEKSRSEYIIAPILFEFKKQLPAPIRLFSGNEFTVNEEQGLSGDCDFLISYSSDPLTIEAPFIVFVEAKHDKFPSALGECMATMLAAQLLNQRHQKEIQTVYGCVTTGTNWKFLQLIEQRIEVDLHEYFLDNLGQVLGILHDCIKKVHGD